LQRERKREREWELKRKRPVFDQFRPIFFSFFCFFVVHELSVSLSHLFDTACALLVSSSFSNPENSLGLNERTEAEVKVKGMTVKMAATVVVVRKMMKREEKSAINLKRKLERERWREMEREK